MDERELAGQLKEAPKRLMDWYNEFWRDAARAATLASLDSAPGGDGKWHVWESERWKLRSLCRAHLRPWWSRTFSVGAWDRLLEEERCSECNIKLQTLKAR